MNLKLRLVRDNEIIFEIPLSSANWSRQELIDELAALDEHFQSLSKIFNALSNKTRLMMMRQLVEKKNRSVNFTDFMRSLDLNPKLVWENARKLSECGLLVKTGRGTYRCSQFGETSFMMISFALRRLIEASEEL